MHGGIIRWTLSHLLSYITMRCVKSGHPTVRAKHVGERPTPPHDAGQAWAHPPPRDRAGLRLGGVGLLFLRSRILFPQGEALPLENRDLSGFHLRESCLCKKRNAVQIGVDNQQASLWFEHAGDFSQPSPLEVGGHLPKGRFFAARDHPEQEVRESGPGNTLPLRLGSRLPLQVFALKMRSHMPYAFQSALMRLTYALTSRKRNSTALTTIKPAIHSSAAMRSAL